MSDTGLKLPENVVYFDYGMASNRTSRWLNDTQYVQGASNMTRTAIINQFDFSALSSVSNLRITGFKLSVLTTKLTNSSVTLHLCHELTQGSSSKTTIGDSVTIVPTNGNKTEYVYTSGAADSTAVSWLNNHISTVINGTDFGLYVAYTDINQFYCAKLALIYDTVTYHTISTAVSPSGSGTVTGGGTYENGASVTLTATPASNYHFVSWNDGNTNASRTITVSGDATYTATFAIDTHTITTAVSPSGSGTVTGAGTYNHGSTVTLTATPATGYEFVKWSDNNTSSSRTVTVTAAATYTATFRLKTYTIYLKDDEGNSLGSVTATHGSSPVISTTPTKQPSGGATYTFRAWNTQMDGTGTAYTLNGLPAATGSTTYFAQFDAVYSEPDIASITVAPNPATGGQGVVVTVTFET